MKTLFLVTVMLAGVMSVARSQETVEAM